MNQGVAGIWSANQHATAWAGATDEWGATDERGVASAVGVTGMAGFAGGPDAPVNNGGASCRQRSVASGQRG